MEGFLYNFIMKNLLVVPSYNMNFDCYNIVKKNIALLSDFETVIVDNKSSDLTYLNLLKKDGVNVVVNKFNGAYEAGALLQCYQDYEADNFFLLQDSIEINDSEAFKYYCNNETCNFVMALRLFFPAYHKMHDDNKKLFNSKFNKLRKYLLYNPGIQYNTFICKKEHIDAIVDKKIFTEEKLPKNKFEQQNWERVFGLAFHDCQINIMALEVIYDDIWFCVGKYQCYEKTISEFKNVFTKKYMKRH